MTGRPGRLAYETRHPGRIAIVWFGYLPLPPASSSPSAAWNQS